MWITTEALEIVSQCEGAEWPARMLKRILELKESWAGALLMDLFPSADTRRVIDNLSFLEHWREVDGGSTEVIDAAQPYLVEGPSIGISAVSLLQAAIERLPADIHQQWFGVSESTSTLNFVARRRAPAPIAARGGQAHLDKCIRLLDEDVRSLPHLGPHHWLLAFATHAFTAPSAYLLDKASRDPIFAYPQLAEVDSVRVVEGPRTLVVDADALWPGTIVGLHHREVPAMTQRGYSVLLRAMISSLANSEPLPTTAEVLRGLQP